MKTFSVSQFKAHALGILDAVAQTGEGIIVTRRGKPLARVLPYREPERESRPGRLSGTITFEEDLVTPPVDVAGPVSQPKRDAKRGGRP